MMGTYLNDGVAALTSISEPRSAESTSRLAIGIACVAVLVRLAPAILTYGTSDVGTWELLGAPKMVWPR